MEAQEGKLKGQGHPVRVKPKVQAGMVLLEDPLLSTPATLPQRRNPTEDMLSDFKHDRYLQEGAYASGLSRKAGKGSVEGSYRKRNPPSQG